MAINTPSIEYAEMCKRWSLPEALDGGTQKMRDGETKWLPQNPNESDEAYEARLNRTFLFNVYKRTIDNLVGIAFTSNVAVEGVPEELDYLEYNINGEGQSLTELCAQLFRDTLHFGKSHTYPDFPVLAEGEKPKNYIEYKELNLRPYVARVSPKNIIGWSHEYRNGIAFLKSVRIQEQFYREDEDFVQTLVHQILHITTDKISTWESVSGGEWEMVGSRENETGAVSLLTAYGNKQAPLVAHPVLEDLAWLNLAHYQSTSDQRNILHVARVPFLLAKGFSEEQMASVTLAANRMVLTEEINADIKFVEHTGQAIGAGQKDLDKLEDQMSKNGAEVLYSKSVARQTLGGRKIDQAESLSVTQIAIRSVEQMMEKAYEQCAEWIGLDTDSLDISINIGSDLELPDDPNPVQSLALLQDLLGMDDETLLEEVKRRGFVAAHVKPDELFKHNPEEPEQDIQVVEDLLNDESA